MSNHTTHIAVEVLEALIEHLRARGADVDAMLSRHDIQYEELVEAGFMDFERFRQLFTHAVEVVADPCLGLHVGEGFMARHWGRLGYLIISGKDGFEGLQYLQRFARIVTNALDVRFELEGSAVHCNIVVNTSRAHSQIVDYFVSSAFALSQLMTNGTFRMRSIAFQHAPAGDPGLAAEYERVLCAPCRFGAPANCIVVDASQFSPQSMHRDPRLKKLLEEHATLVLQRLETDNAWLREVRSFVVESLPNGLPSLKDTAEHFGQNERTFQRALGRVGVNFQELVDELRMNLALEYMRNDYGFLDIALMLGYSEQSAFHRAFKRWTGLPPSRYKKEVMR
jgi:AraC-like DNA-binding protein